MPCVHVRAPGPHHQDCMRPLAEVRSTACVHAKCCNMHDKKQLCMEPECLNYACKRRAGLLQNGVGPQMERSVGSSPPEGTAMQLKLVGKVVLSLCSPAACRADRMCCLEPAPFSCCWYRHCGAGLRAKITKSVPGDNEESTASAAEPTRTLNGWGSLTLSLKFCVGVAGRIPAARMH